MELASLFVCALLFGGMVIYAFGFAAFLFTALPPDIAGPTVRKAFPHFYTFVLVCSLIGAISFTFFDQLASFVMVAIVVTVLPTRQILMPAINAATDSGNKKLFGRLHGLSVAITLAHIAATAFVLGRFV